MTTPSLLGFQLYDRDALLYWQARYSRSTNKILMDVIAPTLKDGEARLLENLHVAFPLRSDPIFQVNTTIPPPTLILPVEMLKLTDELCVADAWLARQGRSDVLKDYIAMLKYLKDPPSPLTAFGIGKRQANRPEVNRAALHCFNSIRAYLLAWGLGELKQRAAKGQAQPAAADRFAVALLSRINAPPEGISLFFLTQAILAAKPWESEDHALAAPLNAARIRGIIQALADSRGAFKNSSKSMEKLLSDLRAVADYLDDPEQQRALAKQAARIEPEALRQR